MRNFMKSMTKGNCTGFALLTALALGVTACGDDGAVAGPQAVTGGDTNGGNDGALSGDDAATLSDGAVLGQDAAIGSDGTTGFVCGNGVCEGPTETPVSCPVDCHSIVVGPDATSSNPVCGNGICEAPNETMLLCAADCKTPASAAETCKHQACGKEYDACTADPACVTSVKCFNAGGGNECVTSQQVGQEVQALSQCVAASGCPGTTQGGGGGGGGGGTTATCGNGTCDQGETMLTCPKDCTGPQSTTEACYHQACPSQYAACSADPQCVKIVDCYNTGGQPQQCGNDPAQSALDQCVQASGCNGQTGGGGGGGGLKNCGNGTCDPDETELTCPADCKTAVNPQETCLQTSCPAQYKSCQADSACVTVVDCLVNNANNPQQCMGGGMTPAVQGLFQCAQQANCLGGGGGGGGGGTPQTTCQGNCGNFSNVAGSCQCDNQCPQNGDCCKDYTSLCSATPPPVCGDGTCTAPQETATNCPKDSAPPAPTPCKTKNDCAATEVCCGLASGSVCLPTGQCK